MDDLNDNEIGKLLRLKRFEQPPPAYFENFLHEFHRRQRDELLRQPLWRVCWQRFSDSCFRLNIPSLTSYRAAVAAVLICAAVLSLKIYQAPESSNLAANNPVASVQVANPGGELKLDSPVTFASRGFDSSGLRQMNESANTHRAAAPPRYVLDRLPVSYEPAFSF
jgi:hypothetical protein